VLLMLCTQRPFLLTLTQSQFFNEVVPLFLENYASDVQP
jgi:hypothetical protein